MIFLSFAVTCTASQIRASVLFYLFIYFFVTRYGTCVKMSQSGRNVPFGRFYLSLRAGMSSQLTRPRKNELPFLYRFTSGCIRYRPAQIARRSRYVSATRARINNGVNERRVSRTRSTFFPPFDRPHSPACPEQPGIHAGNVSELRERIDRSIADFNVPDRSPMADRSE